MLRVVLFHFDLSILAENPSMMMTSSRRCARTWAPSCSSWVSVFCLVHYRRASRASQEAGGGPHRHGPLHELRLLPVVQTGGQQPDGLPLPRVASRVPRQLQGLVVLPEVRLPLFVDRRRVYDWDEFSKIPGCTVGPHSCEPKSQAFAPSPTVAAINNAVNAAAAPAASAAAPAAAPAAPQIKSIDEYNSQNPNAPTAVRSLEKMLSEKSQPKPMKGSGEGEVTRRRKGAVSA